MALASGLRALRRRGAGSPARSLGVAVAVALLATLAGFFAATRASMTRQAIADVAVDWQVQLAPGSDPQAAIAELGRSPGYTSTGPGRLRRHAGIRSQHRDTTQTTGPGKGARTRSGYRAAFPAEIRDLIGQGSVLLAQQTAANLHAAPGLGGHRSKRPGLDPVR